MASGVAGGEVLAESLADEAYWNARGTLSTPQKRWRQFERKLRGSDGVRRMYGAGDFPVYKERFRTQLYCERVVYPEVWNRSSWSRATTTTKRCSTTR
jgi:hypothetical protein